jgi:prepilin-type N-terminal cleavage/methylation domain-containing protein
MAHQGFTLLELLVVIVVIAILATRGSGFRGRTGIYELVWMDEEMRALVVNQRPAGELRRAAMSKGMISLREDGRRQVRAGTTTIDEVLRVTEMGG